MADRDPQNRRSSPSSQELDDFWSIDRLLPDRPTRRPPPPPRPTPVAVDVELEPRRATAKPEAEPVGDAKLTVTAFRTAEAASRAAVAASRPAEARTEGATVHYVPPHKAEEAVETPIREYTPDGVLIHRVKVFGWRSNFHYFDQFGRDAARYAAATAPAEARRESFFSYFPQYVQMNRRQAAWYLWWREQVRRGVFPDTDYAYILLYIFELINLPSEDAETARLHRDRLAAVWIAYRRVYPQLDHYMCEWLCDFCLIHGEEAPLDMLAPALDDIIAGSRLKEFYLAPVIRPSGGGAASSASLETARILLRHCCQYDYRKSKFAQGEHKALYDNTIPAAVAATLPLILGQGGTTPVLSMLASTVTRDAYTGALCAYGNKRRIEVAYTSFSRSHELRFLIADMVKHVENRLRAWIGVRSRLSVMSLPTPLRNALDAYLDPLAPPKSAAPTKKKEEPRPAYEALYDLPRKAVSITDAAAIEADSWATTRILTEAFGGEVATASEAVALFETAEAVMNAEGTASADVPDGAVTAEVMARADVLGGAVTAEATETAEAPADAGAGRRVPVEDAPLGEMTPFVIAALSGDKAAQRAAARAIGKMPDAVADAVNALTADGDPGDIILEDDGTGFYAVIGDYREDVERMLSL